MRESYDIFTVCLKDYRYRAKRWEFWIYVIPDTLTAIKWWVKNKKANNERSNA